MATSKGLVFIHPEYDIRNAYTRTSRHARTPIKPISLSRAMQLGPKSAIFSGKMTESDTKL